MNGLARLRRARSRGRRRAEALDFSAYNGLVAAHRELNLISVGDKEFLVTGGSGQAVHLTREVGSDEAGRPPFHEWRLNPKRPEGRILRERYSVSSLSDSRWAASTLCGRHWISMRTETDSSGSQDGGYVTSPTCRRCLAVMDKVFPDPELDSRFPLVVKLLTDTVLEHGTAEIQGVPGDHQAALRKEVRAAVRRRVGLGMETFAHESVVVFMCRVIFDQHSKEHARRAAEVMNSLMTGEPVAIRPSPTRLSWETWATE